MGMDNQGFGNKKPFMWITLFDGEENEKLPLSSLLCFPSLKSIFLYFLD